MAINKSLFYKELSKKDSNDSVKELLKKRIKLQAKYHMQPGNLLFTSYNAKDKTNVFDKTPLVLILRRGSKYTLGLNFHWLPVNKRIFLINYIMKMNKNNIRDNKPLDFNYSDLKPMLKKLGYAPCIRLYINARLGRIGVVIKPDQLLQVARIRGESFTGGKYSSAQMYKKSLKR